jgi:hypothetical protein
MNERASLRSLPPKTGFKKGDVFVLFGELFDRGYASGLVAEARDAGMEIFGMTTGRRIENNVLRPLTADELSAAEANLGGRIVNVPLMSGFELDAPEGGLTPRDVIGKLTMANWREHKFDWDYLGLCRELGATRFRNAAKLAFSQLGALIPAGRDVFFAHTMAGGVPKTKIFLAVASRIYKGRGPRFLSSAEFVASDMGRLVLQNFEEVTANTFGYLIEGTAELRERVTREGGTVRYSAYGYHGTEILIDDRYQWQSYVNYTQGYAKMKLERIAAENWARGVRAVVFNCPEIRTNSSDIFTGVELPLFSLLLALKKENGGAWAQAQWQACRDLLGDATLDAVMTRIKDLNASEVVARSRDFANWPTPNDPDLAEIVISTSEAIEGLHKSRDALIADYLSALVVKASGSLISREMTEPLGPVIWLNHDIIARQLNDAAPNL